MEFIPTRLGVALIEGFDRMNLETSLGKPFLRKEMELKMKAIGEGLTTRQLVLQESIGQYRQVYDQSEEQLHVLKSVCPATRNPRATALANGIADPKAGLQAVHL